MTIQFEYEKGQVLQALRYHFISRPEIRIMIILVNVFAIFAIVIYAMGKVQPLAFLVSSLLWIVLMISFWFVLPGIVYRRSETFRHPFKMRFTEEQFELIHEHGSRAWAWNKLSKTLESPHFFHLYFDARSFFIVPKNAFDGPAELGEMRDMLKRLVK